MEQDGRIVRKGNLVTILLFVGLVAAKFAMGVLAYFQGIQDGAGFGEIMVMIAIMVAFQAEIVFRRAQKLARSVHASGESTRHGTPLLNPVLVPPRPHPKPPAPQPERLFPS